MSAPQPSVQNLFSSNTLGGHISTLSLQVRESQIFFCQIVVPNNNSIGSWIIYLISIKGFQLFLEGLEDRKILKNIVMLLSRALLTLNDELKIRGA